VASIIEVRALLPLVTLTAARTPVTGRNRAGKTDVQLSVYDQLRVGGDATGPTWAVELDELPGYERSARRARRVLDELGLKASAGDLLDLPAARSAVGAGYDSSPTVVFARGETAFDGFRRVLAHLATSLQANWQGTVDDVDPEFLHDFRVAIRRTRTVLAQGKRVLPDDVRVRYRDGFAWLGEITGPARDLDVYVTEWPTYVAPLGEETRPRLAPLLEYLSGQRAAAHRQLSEELQSLRYLELLDTWPRWLTEPSSSGLADGALPMVDVASRRIRRAQRTIIEAGRAIRPASPPSQLHELRKEAKRLRYLIECFGGLFPPRRRRDFVKVLKALQDNLGEYQDAGVQVDRLRVASEELHQHGTGGPELFLAMGELTLHFEQRREAARAEFAEQFAAYDSKDTTRRLRALLDPAAR
jgi:CHAD domain-containing protein